MKPQTAVCALLIGVGWLGQLDAADDPKMTPPPGDESPEIRALIDRAKSALDSRRTVNDVLTDEAFMPARAYARFRSLIRDHAPEGTITLVPAGEPGTKLHVRGIVKDANGRPIAGTMIYAYHTSAKGWYSDKAAHIGGNSGDVKHARLFAYVKTDAHGRYEMRTIRPASYPNTDLPQHIHVHVDGPNGRRETLVTEILFEDDPRLTKSVREEFERGGNIVCPVKREANGVHTVVADFVVR
jgi:protocatechuate 3,4-dioxygenase beta subunit